MGTAPIDISYLRTGINSLMAIKSGYHTATDTIRIDPNETLTIQMALDRKRSWKWWLYRIGPIVLVGVAAAIILNQKYGSDQPLDEPLPEPPPPP